MGSYPAGPAGGAHPRLRGEHLGPRRSGDVFPGSSPLTRGAPARPSFADDCAGLIPAYAGSTTSTCWASVPKRAHPRLRGEHGLSAAVERDVEGSSPLTRGAPEAFWSGGSHNGLIPAYAGSTLATISTAHISTAHPRLRGEHICFSIALTAAAGSSPLTRGARDDTGRLRVSVRLIPAYAGSTAR